jgi:RNA-directed DNA polymerase
VVSFEHIDHDWLRRMLSLRIDDRAFLDLIGKWLKAGILDTNGAVLQPETGTPQGGIVSPVLANLYLHYVLDLWFERVVRPRCRGEVLLCRYADDFVCAFRFSDDAQRFFTVLPKRLEKFGLEVAPEKTQVLRFSRFHPSMRRRITFLGFELFWFPDRNGTPQVMRRTARKKLHGAIARITDWIKSHRHLPGREFIKGLNRRLLGHYNYYGLRGNSRGLWCFYQTAVESAFKWLNRRGGKRRSFTWPVFNRALQKLGIARPRITEKPGAQPVFA